jgi:lysozyme
MKHTKNATDIITVSEGLKLTAYQDQNKIWTIGYGHTGSHTAPGTVITQEQALSLLDDDVSMTEKAINSLVTVPLNQNQFDALVSFVFNIGSGHFAGSIKHGMKPSTTFVKLQQSDYKGAADAILFWNKAGGKVAGGLVTRRAKERELFLRAV